MRGAATSLCSDQDSWGSLMLWRLMLVVESSQLKVCLMVSISSYWFAACLLWEVFVAAWSKQTLVPFLLQGFFKLTSAMTKAMLI
jgi:hypothetical protein